MPAGSSSESNPQAGDRPAYRRTAARLDVGAAAAAAIKTVQIEAAGLDDLVALLEQPSSRQAIEAAARLILQAQGRTVVTGMGKSGIVARKLAATLASTGTPSLFLHPAEASHGDLGMITGDDVVLAISWSGETPELSDVVDYCRRFDLGLIAMTAAPESTLARVSSVTLPLPLVEEACPNGLAPTSSTTVQVALGDALAVALMAVRQFSSDDFRINHPRGRLGTQLLRVGDLMSVGHDIPVVLPQTSIVDAMVEMSSKRFGAVAIVDPAGRLRGTFTDGDLRRSVTAVSLDAQIDGLMTRDPLTIRSDQLASEALAIMNGHSVLQLLVCDAEQLVGMVHLHDILRAGVA